MSLQLQHFDTKLRQDLDVREKIDNSLAEYLFPKTEFAIGMVYEEAAIPADLKDYQDKTLQFASGERLYFASQAVRGLLYPVASDGAAYGSLVFTPNQSFTEKSDLQVLVIDDKTGENGEIMPPDAAKKLVGDCCGRISEQLATELTGVSNTPFQFRIGIKPQPGNDFHRIAKGTLAPSDFSNLSTPYLSIEHNQAGELRIKPKYDLILATSSFKGRKGKENNEIQPGLYNLTLGIGVKTLAKYGEHSLGTQVLTNYPRGVQTDILPQLLREANRLSEVQSEPRQLAQLYVDKYERRQSSVEFSSELKPHIKADLEDLGAAIDAAFGDEDTEEQSAEQEKQDLLLYRLLKADLSGHTQILEHPKIIDRLNEFVNNQWKDIATGRAIKFKAGLAQPSLDLGKDEICVPRLAEGEEVIVTRSPLVNSNGVIILKNRHLPEFQDEQGTIHIHPQTAAEHLQADFDGDRLAFEKASKYPTLAAEIKEYNLAQNRYPDVVKRPDKLAYTGTFEQIALSAMENKIGLIANQIQKAVALQWETQLIPDQEKPGYLNKISNHYKKLIKDHSNPSKDLQIPLEFKERIEKLANLPRPLSSEQVNTSLSEVKQLLFDTVGKLSNELQVAVDGPKSAARPDETVMSYCKAISDYTSVGWLADKKKPGVYLERPMASTNYSPVDLMVQQANKLYSESHQTARQINAFQPLFLASSFTKNQGTEAKKITQTYNSLIKQAIEWKERAKQDTGPTLIATSTASGKQIQIHNLLQFDPKNSPVWTEKTLDIKLYATEEKGQPNALKAVVVTDREGNPCQRTIGIVAAASVKEHNLKEGTRLQATVTLTSGATATQVKAKFKEAADYLEQVRHSTPAHEQPALAAALWQVNHARGGENSNSLRKASVAFNAFPDQVLSQLSNLQFTNLSVVGIHQPTSELQGKKWRGETVQAAIALETDRASPNYGRRIVTVEGLKLAPLSTESPSLPVGTRFLAEVTSAPGAAVIATTSKGNSLKITESKNHSFAGREWSGESTQVQVGFLTNPNPSKPPIPVALIKNQVLGVLDKDSAGKLRAVNLLKPGVTFDVTLQTAPATTAHVKVNPKSVVYPSQQSEPQPTPTQTPVTEKGQTWAITDKSLKIEDWSRVAIAVGRADKYVERVQQTLAAHQGGKPLSEQATTAMQQDFQKWQQTRASLQRWHEAAAAIGKSSQYLDRIAQVAVNFSSDQPTPLSQAGLTALETDINAAQKPEKDVQNQVKNSEVPSQLPHSSAPSPQKLWQQYSQRTNSPNPVSKQLEVARLALAEGIPEAQIRQILQANPYLQRFGEKGARDLVELPLQKVKAESELSKQSQEQSQHRRQKEGPQF